MLQQMPKLDLKLFDRVQKKKYVQFRVCAQSCRHFESYTFKFSDFCSAILSNFHQASLVLVSGNPPVADQYDESFRKALETSFTSLTKNVSVFVCHAQLIKPQNGFLGIVLVGGADTPLENHYVNDILPNSSASKSGRVRGGDEILEANGQALRGKSHAEALTIFRSLPAVVELVVARTKDANRTILERLNHEKKDNKKVNNNIASPKRRRSVIEEAAKTSVIPRSLSSVIDVTKKACLYVKPVKRVSRVSSFVGTEENEVTVKNAVNLKDDKRKGNQEATSEQKDNKFNGMEEVSISKNFRKCYEVYRRSPDDATNISCRKHFTKTKEVYGETVFWCLA